MDTRAKILTVAAARALEPARPLAIAAGTFDVLLAEDARELAEVRNRTGARTVMVVVLRSAREVLNQRGRAELAAALCMVDYVLTAGDEEFDKLVACFRPTEVVHLEGAHARRLGELIEHARERQIAG